MDLLIDRFVVIDRDNWQRGQNGGFLDFPDEALPETILANKYRIQTIKDDTARGTNIAHRFMNLKIDAFGSCTSKEECSSRKKQNKCVIFDGNLRKHQQAVCSQLSGITNCDIFYASLAVKEREKLSIVWK